MRWRQFPTRSTASLVGAAATALVVAVALGGCGSDATSGDQGLGPGAPAVGICRLLTAADIGAATNDSPTVPCTTSHTSTTIYVGSFPDWKVTSRNLTDGTLGDEALQKCTAVWQRTVGGDLAARHTTVAGLAYYLPDPDQLTDGARWFRCDLVIGGRDSMELHDVPSDVAGLLDGALPDALRACRTTPDFTGGRQVPCTRPHVLRAVGIAPLPDSPGYPGEAALEKLSSQACTPVVRRWLHGRVGAGIAFQWPDRTSWQLLADRSATCWVVTAD